MVKRILVPLDDSPYTDAVMAYSCELAKHCRATLTGLTVLDMPGIEKSVGTIPVGGIQYADKLVKAKVQSAIDYIGKLINKFEERCTREGIAHNVAECQGNPSSQIIHESLYYDRVVVGMRTFYHIDKKNIEGDSIANLLDSTITPIVAMPANYNPGTPPHGKFRILIAYNDSLPASRALHRFVQVQPRQDYEILLLYAGGVKNDALNALDKATEFLGAHGITSVKTRWTSQNIVDAVKERYLDWADKVVLGMHSKKGLIDFMVGSLSRYLINDGSKVLLLGQ